MRLSENKQSVMRKPAQRRSMSLQLREHDNECRENYDGVGDNISGRFQFFDDRLKNDGVASK